MKKLTEALKDVLDKHPGNGTDEFKDISTLMDQTFREAGYELQLHQHGISGTSIIAVKLTPPINIETQFVKEAA